MKKLAAIAVAMLVLGAFAVAAFAANTTLTTTMTGKQETPKGSPTGKGTARITLEPGVGKVCFRLTWSGIGNPTASHIHKGRRGTAGPVVVPLFGGTAKHSGCVRAARSLIRRIAKSPGGYYVNIHTVKYPAGALRGQL